MQGTLLYYPANDYLVKFHQIPSYITEMQLTVGPVWPREQNFRGSVKWRLCVRPNDWQIFLLLGAVKNQISVGPWLPLRPLSEGSLIIVNKVKSRKQIGKNFCSFLFMLNFGNQFPFRILFRILSGIVVNCNLIISVMAAWPMDCTRTYWRLVAFVYYQLFVRNICGNARTSS